MTFLAPAPDDPRRVALRRMRLLATSLLLLMTLLFVGTWFVPQDLPALGYVRAFAEAGMVGACADWFAVVALFRHPLGLPIPHTAIVPHNQKRIAGAMGRFVANNFLSPTVLAERFAALQPARWAADWLAQPGHARRVARTAATILVEVARAIPREQVGETLSTLLRRGLHAVPAAPVASRLLAIVWAQGQSQQAIEAGLRKIRAWLLENPGAIRQKVEEKSSRWIPRWVDGVVAERMVGAVSATLDEMLDPAHPWRQDLKAAVETLIDRLRHDPALAVRAEEIKRRILADPLFEQQLSTLWDEIGNALPADLAAKAGPIEDALESLLGRLGRWLAEDAERIGRINRWIRTLLRRGIVPQRDEIGAFVTQVVERWDSRTLVDRMELQVGRDLQYVRINGTLVGGAVGLLIYAVSRFFVDS